MENKDLIIKLFNSGKLTLETAKLYQKIGYSVIVNDGEVVDIVKEEI